LSQSAAVIFAGAAGADDADAGVVGGAVSTGFALSLATGGVTSGTMGAGAPPHATATNTVVEKRPSAERDKVREVIAREIRTMTSVKTTFCA